MSENDKLFWSVVCSLVFLMLFFFGYRTGTLDKEHENKILKEENNELRSMLGNDGK